MRAYRPTKKAVTEGLKFHQVYVKPLSRSRDSFSLRLGHAPALTVHRTVIHYRRAALLPEWEPTRCCRQHLTASLHLISHFVTASPRGEADYMHIASALGAVARRSRDGGGCFIKNKNFGTPGYMNRAARTHKKSNQ